MYIDIFKIWPKGGYVPLIKSTTSTPTRDRHTDRIILTE